MRIGIIGTGWGRMHIGGFRRAGAEVVALCGSTMEKTAALARREGVALATTEVRELCAACDAVVVASPDKLHREHVVAVIEAGRHVLCEKPLATSAAEADSLAALARAAKVRTAVSFPYRMLRPFEVMRAFAREALGLEIMVRNSFIQPSDESGDFGGASHFVDAALWLMRATPKAVVAQRTARALRVLIETATGASITIVHRPSAEPGIWGSWSLWGDRWEAGVSAGFRPSLGGWHLEPPRGFHDGTWRDLAPGVSTVPGALEPWAQAHVDTARAFLELIATGSPGALASFDDGAAVQRVLEMAGRS